MMSSSLFPTQAEYVNRARADITMGQPWILQQGAVHALMAAILHRALEISSVRLLTNNPNKVATLVDQGNDVTERLPVRVGKRAQNRNCFSVKALKSGHYL